jgi:hypothetical protein
MKKNVLKKHVRRVTWEGRRNPEEMNRHPTLDTAKVIMTTQNIK